MAVSVDVGRRTEEQIVEKVIPLMQETAAAIGADLRLLGGSQRLDATPRDGFY
jgi:IclR family pca regulon transcriptional regulator